MAFSDDATIKLVIFSEK